MSIVFDQVDGVVQRDADPPNPPAGSATTATAAPTRPAVEQFEETRRRLEWLTRRLTAD